MDKYIKIQIKTNGEAKIEPVGIKGADCKIVTQPHEKIYSEVISAEDKPELYEGASCPVETVRAG
jgi:hypothetical protein